MSSRLTHASHLVLRDGLPWTVIVIREGSPYKELAALCEGPLTTDELYAWLTAFGISVDDNPWDFFDPEARADPADIPFALRLPSESEEQIPVLL